MTISGASSILMLPINGGMAIECFSLDNQEKSRALPPPLINRRHNIIFSVSRICIFGKWKRGPPPHPRSVFRRRRKGSTPEVATADQRAFLEVTSPPPPPPRTTRGDFWGVGKRGGFRSFLLPLWPNCGSFLPSVARETRLT